MFLRIETGQLRPPQADGRTFCPLLDDGRANSRSGGMIVQRRMDFIVRPERPTRRTASTRCLCRCRARREPAMAETFNPQPVEILLVDDNEDDVVLLEESFRDSKFLNLMQVVHDGEEA